jgi:SAM-dependent methyltransferase
VLDLGAGRAAWHSLEIPSRRAVRDIRDASGRVIAVDVDQAVLDNPIAHERMVMRDGRIPLPTGSVDVVVCDYVLEHVEHTTAFALEVDRVLRSGGLFCARTPHRFEYVAIGARVLKRISYRQFRNRAVPDRPEIDAFPTFYRMNTRKALRQLFPRYEDHSYLYCSEPGYHFNNPIVFGLLSIAHRVLPRVLVSNLFVFMRKP